METSATASRHICHYYGLAAMYSWSRTSHLSPVEHALCLFEPGHSANTKISANQPMKPGSEARPSVPHEPQQGLQGHLQFIIAHDKILWQLHCSWPHSAIGSGGRVKHANASKRINSELLPCHALLKFIRPSCCPFPFSVSNCASSQRGDCLSWSKLLTSEMTRDDTRLWQ